MFGLFETGWLRVKPEIIRIKNPTLAQPSFYFGQEIRSLRRSFVQTFGLSVIQSITYWPQFDGLRNVHCYCFRVCDFSKG